MLSLGLSVLQETFQAGNLEERCYIIRDNIEYYGTLRGQDYEWIDGAGKHERIPFAVLPITVQLLPSP